MPVEDYVNKLGKHDKRLRFEVCNLLILDHAHTAKKHTGYKGCDEKGLPIYGPEQQAQGFSDEQALLQCLLDLQSMQALTNTASTI